MLCVCTANSVFVVPDAFSSLIAAWTGEPCWRQTWDRLHWREVWGTVLKRSKAWGRQEWGRDDGGMRQREREWRHREKLCVTDGVAASLTHIRSAEGPQGPGFTLTALYQPLWAQVQCGVSVTGPQGHQAGSWGEAHTQTFVIQIIQSLWDTECTWEK